MRDLLAISKKTPEKNVIIGDIIAKDTYETYIRTYHKLGIVIGIKNAVVVETSDVLLVANIDNAKDIQAVTQQLIENHRHEAIKSNLVHRPWGNYEILYQAANIQVKKIIIHPASSLSLQSHQFRFEHWIIVRGKANITRGHEVFVLSANESTFIPMGTKHR